jgi:CBS domain-containing protein
MDVMVRDVIKVGREDTIADAAKLIAQNDVSALPVVDEEGQLVGIISESDLMNRGEIGTSVHHPWWIEAVTPAATLAQEFAKSHGKRVKEVMSDNVITATEETPLAEIAAILERNRKARPNQSRRSLRMAPDWPGDWTQAGSSEAERKALIALAEGVPGVTQAIEPPPAARLAEAAELADGRHRPQGPDWQQVEHATGTEPRPEERRHRFHRPFLTLVTPGEGQEDTRARAAIPSEPAQRRIVETNRRGCS